MEMSAVTTNRLLEGILKMALFLMEPYLNDRQRLVFLTLSKVKTILNVMHLTFFMPQIFKIAYCDFFATSLYEEWSKICVAFVEAHTCLSYFRSRKPT